MNAQWLLHPNDSLRQKSYHAKYQYLIFLLGKYLITYCFFEIKVVINDRFFYYEQIGKQQPTTKQKEMKCNRWILRADKADI